MIPSEWQPLANHLWQSTLFAAAAALIALALRKNRAHVRYWLWLVASVKFLVPFSLLVGLGSQVPWRSAPAVVPVPAAIEQIGTPFAPSSIPSFSMPAAPSTFRFAPWLLVAIWLAGGIAVLALWGVRWLRMHRVARAASPVPIAMPVPVMSSPALLEPGIFGIVRPVLLLPEGIANRLTATQFEAILAHELCHIRRHDNLAAAMHMAVEALFWFHPLVWWIGARMIEERERACDEEVLRLGSEPQVYAEGILKVCKFYLESHLACASGVTGADLKKRIEAIMTQRIASRLGLGRKLLLAVTGLTAVAGPILIGIVHAPRSQAQAKTDAATFEVASIKPASPDARNVRIMFLPGGGLRTENVRLKQLVELAYQVLPFQIQGGPGWINSEAFDILAKAPQPADTRDLAKMSDAERRLLQEQMRRRLQALLAERFQLAIRRSTKEGPVYALVTARNGPKLKASTAGDGGPQHMRAGRGDLAVERGTMEMFAGHLSRVVGRPVLDRTGLTGAYDFELHWTPDPGGADLGKENMAIGRTGGGGPGGPGGPAPAPPPAADLSGASIFTAIQEQLGLKLESTKGPVDVLTIERAERPSEN
ncbi:MAG TPA: M56 and DUF3738 domain-containing protein [Bryobacteraceae bacterium]|nr:M56 and DUF3738 domain-containing protein [Bryobacteraceae bacterium]